MSSHRYTGASVIVGWSLVLGHQLSPSPTLTRNNVTIPTPTNSTAYPGFSQPQRRFWDFLNLNGGSGIFSLVRKYGSGICRNWLNYSAETGDLVCAGAARRDTLFRQKRQKLRLRFSHADNHLYRNRHFHRLMQLDSRLHSTLGQVPLQGHFRVHDCYLKVRFP